jgi:Outer membrane protein beta-barrel domain
MPRLLLLCIVLLSALATGPKLAEAQDRGGYKLRLGGAMSMDFAGQVDPDGPRNNDDARLTPGLRFHLDYELAKHFSLGGFAKFSFWRGDDFFEDRSMWFDLGPRIKGHFDWRDFRFYGTMMVGLTISKLNNDLDAWDNPGFGANVAIGPGVEWWFDRRFAVFSEIFGWSGHFFNHDTDGLGGNLDIRVNQVLWNIGMLFGV